MTALRNVVVGAIALAMLPILAPVGLVLGFLYVLRELGEWIMDGCPELGGM